MFKNLLKSLPFQLIMCIVAAFIGGDYLSYDWIVSLFTVSCLLKEILMAILPLIIFSYIAAALLSLEQKAPILIISILALVIVSNAVAAFVSYGVGMSVLPYITLGDGASIALNSKEMLARFTLSLPQLLSPDRAMILGIIFGLTFSFFKNPLITKGCLSLQKYVTHFLEKVFVPCLPLYVLGFVLKMQYEGSLTVLLQNYGQVFGLVCLLLVSYIALMYLLASRFRFTNFTQMIQQMVPAGLTGFSTISSAVTMPITLAATEKNIGNTQFAHIAIPATVNIHMVGHGLSIPIISLAVLMLSGYPLPDLQSFSLFVVFYCLAKFSATAIPGGGIIVIVPILQSQLGFTPEMASLMIMLDILQDPILTGANVMGNGAFAMLCYRFCNRLKIVTS